MIEYEIPIVIKKRPTVNDLERYGIFERFRNVTFATLRMYGIPPQFATQVSQVNKYAVEIKSNIKQGKGLILKGPVGTMKTTLAVAIMRRAIDLGHTAFFTPMVSLIDNLFTLKDVEERIKFERKLRTVDILVLDDLGAEYNDKNGFVITKIDAIITERWNRRKATIVTTNLGNEQLVSMYNLRTMDRLASTCDVINFNGDSLRQKKG